MRALCIYRALGDRSRRRRAARCRHSSSRHRILLLQKCVTLYVTFHPCVHNIDDPRVRDEFDFR